MGRPSAENSCCKRKNLSYTYNDDGIRTSKTANGLTTEYFIDGSTILAQKTGNDVMWFLYDSDGTKIGFTYNGTSYYYTKNAQGDITGIVDKTAIPLWNTPTTHGANFSTRPIRRATLISVKRTHSSIVDTTMTPKLGCITLTADTTTRRPVGS